MKCLDDLLNEFYDYVRNTVPEDYMLPATLEGVSGKSDGAEHLHLDYDEWLPLLHVILGLLDIGTTLWFYAFLLHRVRNLRGQRHESAEIDEEYQMHLLYLYSTLFFVILAAVVNLILVLLCGTPWSLFHSLKEIEEARKITSNFEIFDSSHSVVIYGATGPNAQVVNGTYDKTSEECFGGFVYLKRSSNLWEKIYRHIYLQLDIDDEVDEPGTGRWTVLPADSKRSGSGFGWASVPVDLLPDGSGAFIIESNHPYIIDHEPLKKTIKVHDAVGYKVDFDLRCSWGESAILTFNFEGNDEAIEHYLDDGTYRSIEINAPEFVFFFDAGKDEADDETFWGFRIEITPVFRTEPHDIIPSIARTVDTFWNVHDTEDWVPHSDMKVEKVDEQDSYLLRVGAVHHTSWVFELYLLCWRTLECWHLFERERENEQREGTTQWKASDKVLAVRKGATHYSTGYIIHVVDGKCDISFEDGNYETIDTENIQKPDKNCTDTDDISFYILFPFHLMGIALIFSLILCVGIFVKYFKMVFFTILYVLTVLRRAVTFFFVLVDSELMYLFYGRREYYAIMTLSGLYVGTISMSCVQIFYMIGMAVYYGEKAPVNMQLVSLFSTVLHFAFSGIYKQVFHHERPPPARSILFVGRESEEIEKKKDKRWLERHKQYHSFQVHASDLYAHQGLIDGEAKSEDGIGASYRGRSGSISDVTSSKISIQASSGKRSSDFPSGSSEYLLNSMSPTILDFMKATWSPLSIANSGDLDAAPATTDGASPSSSRSPGPSPSSKRRPISPSSSKQKQMAKARNLDNNLQSISL